MRRSRLGTITWWILFLGFVLQSLSRSYGAASRQNMGVLEQHHEVDQIPMTALDELYARHGCWGNVVELLQSSHVYCAVNGGDGGIFSCRNQLALGVITRCLVGHNSEDSTARAGSLSDKKSVCRLSPLSDAVVLFSIEYEIVADDDATVMALINACFDKYEVDSDKNLTQKICSCDLALSHEIACKCTEHKTAPVPFLPQAGTAVRKEIWPHAMFVFGYVLHELDTIVSTLKRHQHISIIQIETVNCTQPIHTLAQRVFPKSEKQCSRTTFLDLRVQICALILFIDRKPSLALYHDRQKRSEYFSNKHAIDIKIHINESLVHHQSGIDRKCDTIYVSYMPEDAERILLAFPGSRPTKAMDYDSSSAAFHSPYFLKTKPPRSLPYSVHIVDLDKIWGFSSATKNTFSIGQEACVFASSRLMNHTVDSSHLKEKGISSTGFISLLSGSFDLFKYPRCVKSILEEYMQRSYVILNNNMRVLDGIHKIQLAAAQGVKRMEVVILGREGSFTPLPCVKEFQDLNEPLPAFKVSLGARVLKHCNISFLILNVSNPFLFPMSLRIGDVVSILTQNSTQKASSCLISAFPRARVSETKPGTVVLIDILSKTLNHVDFFVRFSLNSELPESVMQIYPSWKADMFKSAQTYVSPLGFQWQAPNPKDDAALKYLKWLDYRPSHRSRKGLFNKYVQWMSDHPHILFPFAVPASNVKPGLVDNFTAHQTPRFNDMVIFSKQNCKRWVHRMNTNDTSLQILVFSRSEPSNLLLLLRSFERYVVDWKAVQITVIASTSKVQVVEGYILVQRRYPCIRFIWDMGDSLFHSRVMSILSEVDTELILILSEKYVFIRQIALSDISFAFLFEELTYLSVGKKISTTFRENSGVKVYKFSSGRIDDRLLVWNSHRQSPITGCAHRTEAIKRHFQTSTFQSLEEMEMIQTVYSTDYKNILAGYLGTSQSLWEIPPIQDVPTLSLCLQFRFDIIVKAVYAAEYVEKGYISKTVRDLYLGHLQVWNNFTEPCLFEESSVWFDSSRPCIKKTSAMEFERNFQRIIDSLKHDGFDSSLSLIPVSKELHPLDGAHRVAAAIALRMDTIPIQKTSSENFIYYDESFFVEKGFSQQYVKETWNRFYRYIGIDTTSMIQFLEYAYDNLHAVVVFPSVRNKHINEVKTLLEQFSEVLTERNFTLTSKSTADMFVQQLYPNENWVSNGAWGKTKLCFPEGTERYPVYLWFISTTLSLEEILQLKEHIRGMYGIGKSSIHISDTRSQAMDIARLVINRNSIEHLEKIQWSSPKMRGNTECEIPNPDNWSENTRYYLDGKPCALAVNMSTHAESYQALYRQTKFLRDLSQGRSAFTSEFSQILADSASSKNPRNLFNTLKKGRHLQELQRLENSHVSYISLSLGVKWESSFTDIDPEFAFQLLSNFLGVHPNIKQIGYKIAMTYNGSLKQCLTDYCESKYQSNLHTQCLNGLIDALDKFNPYFACLGLNNQSIVESDFKQSRVCASAMKTVVDYLSRLGLWGWASSIEILGRKGEKFASLVQKLSLEDSLLKILEALNSYIEKSGPREAVHIIRVRVALLLKYFATHHESGQVGKDIIRSTSLMLHWLSQFEFTFTGQYTSVALQCLSYQIQKENFFECPDHLSEIMKWCKAVSSSNKIEKPLAKTDRELNPLLEGAESLFQASNSMPKNRVISRNVVPALNHVERKVKQQNVTEVELLIGVMSKPTNFRRRKSIRKTWARRCHTLNCDVVFVLGDLGDGQEEINRLVQSEQDEFGDLLWIKSNLEGMRHNFTRKVGSFLSYALHVQSPHSPRLVMRTDDDVYVNIASILNEAKLLPTPLYWGSILRFEPVHREGKYGVGYNDFAAGVWPPFMSGGRHILSRDLIEILLLHRPILHGTKSLDDVNIGIQLSDVVDFIDDDRFFRKDLTLKGQCLEAIKSRGSYDFFVCEPNPSKHKEDSELEWKFEELFAMGY